MTIFSVIDLESTGLDPEIDAIVEIACIDVINGQCSYEARRSSLVFPSRDIPAVASSIHHIVDDDVIKAPRARDIIPSILLSEREDVVYVSHNSFFEQSFLTQYLRDDTKWICTWKSALRVWPEAPSHSNQALRYWRNLQVDRKIANYAHRAAPDAYVTAHLLIDLMNHASVEDMLAWTKEPALLPTCPIGKKQGWAGKKWSDPALDNGALMWIVGNIEDENVIWSARLELDRRAKEQSAETEKWAKIKREAYVQAAPVAIKTARTIEDLTMWWKDSQGHFEVHRIVKGDDDYKKLRDACAERKAELLTDESQKEAA